MRWKLKLTKTSSPKMSKDDKFLKDLLDAYEHGGMDTAKELCRYTEGKSAGIAYSVLDMIKENNL